MWHTGSAIAKANSFRNQFNLCSNKRKQIHDSVPNSTHEKINICHSIEKQISPAHYSKDCGALRSELAAAITRLKTNKNDVGPGLISKLLICLIRLH